MDAIPYDMRLEALVCAFLLFVVLEVLKLITCFCIYAILYCLLLDSIIPWAVVLVTLLSHSKIILTTATILQQLSPIQTVPFSTAKRNKLYTIKGQVVYCKLVIEDFNNLTSLSYQQAELTVP